MPGDRRSSVRWLHNSYFGVPGLVVTPATPSLSSLSPNFATASGPAFSVTVNGSGFLTGSSVQWNGSALSTSYVSSSQLSASVPPSLRIPTM